MSRPVRIFLFVTGAIICALSYFFDDSVIAWVGAHPNPAVHSVARFFTKWGDFPPIVALLFLLILLAGLLRQRSAIPILLRMFGSAVCGGLAANILRVLTGRARPSAHVPAGWYGLWHHGQWIAGSYQFSSFPSAHTAVAIACVAPLWIMLARRKRLFIAVPATLLALCIAASRIALNAHHLSDVVTSVWLGILIAQLVDVKKLPARNKAAHIR